MVPVLLMPSQWVLLSNVGWQVRLYAVLSRMTPVVCLPYYSSKENRFKLGTHRVAPGFFFDGDSFCAQRLPDAAFRY